MGHIEDQKSENKNHCNVSHRYAPVHQQVIAQFDPFPFHVCVSQLWVWRAERYILPLWCRRPSSECPSSRSRWAGRLPASGKARTGTGSWRPGSGGCGSSAACRRALSTPVRPCTTLMSFPLASAFHFVFFFLGFRLNWVNGFHAGKPAIRRHECKRNTAAFPLHFSLLVFGASSGGGGWADRRSLARSRARHAFPPVKPSLSSDVIFVIPHPGAVRSVSFAKMAGIHFTRVRAIWHGFNQHHSGWSHRCCAAATWVQHCCLSTLSL